MLTENTDTIPNNFTLMRRVKLTRGLNYGSNVSLQWEMENDLSSSYPTEGVCKLLVTFLIELKKKKKTPLLTLKLFEIYTWRNLNGH